jgi:crotonobetainyl-CoA:carnitine CoA-transferase CaiB-like acyl-CoA transferase
MSDLPAQGAANQPSEGELVGPLAGVRVLGFGSFIAGPFAGQILADFGADVIKIEPIEGEPWRHQSPFMPGESRAFLPLNRGVRSICLNLKMPQAQEALARIVKSADAAISNHRADTTAKLKIDYESLSLLNPRLVYVEITGYGPHGPKAEEAGFDLIMQGFAGAIASEGKISAGAGSVLGAGQPDPVWSSSYIDFSTAYAAASAVMAGVIGRARTGRGQKASTSLLVNALNMQCMRVNVVEGHPSPAQQWFHDRLPELRRTGASYEDIQREYQQVVRARIYRTYYRGYRTKDGGLALGTLAVHARKRLLEYLGLHDPRIEQPGYDETTPEAIALADRITAEFERRFAGRITADWVRELRARDIPCEPIRFIEEAVDDEQALANGYIGEVEHAAGFKWRTAGPVAQFSDGQPPLRSSPALGQHTRDVLSEAGYSSSGIDSLLSSGAAR